MTQVLYTGGSGRLGRAVRKHLAGIWDEVIVYDRIVPTETWRNERTVRGDLADLDELTDACHKVDAIVHLAGVADEAPFEDILVTNIVGTHHVYESARRAGVPRVVFASSNHVIGRYPADETIDTAAPPRPDTYYGVSKVFGEALARLYVDKWDLEVVCLRIGSFRPEPETARQLATWLSHRDGAQLIQRSVEAQIPEFLIAYGISANTRSKWNSEEANRTLGYTPDDNAEIYASRFADDVSKYHGGPFADPGYSGGAW